MLFRYEQPGRHGFWMPDMHFDIDILWIRAGRIVHVEANVPHGDARTIYRPSEPADLVLEVPAGSAARARLARRRRRGSGTRDERARIAAMRRLTPWDRVLFAGGLALLSKPVLPMRLRALLNRLARVSRPQRDPTGGWPATAVRADRDREARSSSRRGPRTRNESTSSRGPSRSRRGSSGTSASSATRASRRASDAPRQKCLPKPKPTWPCGSRVDVEAVGVREAAARRGWPSRAAAPRRRPSGSACPRAPRPAWRCGTASAPARRSAASPRSAAGTSAGSLATRAARSGWSSSAVTALPIRFVVVSLPATSSSITNWITSRIVSAVSPSCSATIRLTRSSAGARRRSSATPRR